MNKDQKTEKQKKSRASRFDRLHFITYKHPMMFLTLCFALFIFTLAFGNFKNPLTSIWLVALIGYAERRSGVSIDFKAKEFREYKTFFFIKFGAWQSLQKYPVTTIKRFQGSLENEDYEDGSDTFYNPKIIEFRFYLASADHRKTLLLKSFKDYTEAKEYALFFEDLTYIPFQTFNPKISAATRARKRKSQMRR